MNGRPVSGALFLLLVVLGLVQFPGAVVSAQAISMPSSNSTKANNVSAANQSSNTTSNSTVQTNNVALLTSMAPNRTLQTANTVQAINTPTPATCLLYAVDQKGHDSSQIFTINLRAKEANALGSPLMGFDIEGLAIHPETHTLYASSGEHSSQPGELFAVNSQTGALTAIGTTGYKDVTGLTFRQTDATLWGWAEGSGLINIDATTGVSTLVFSSTREIKALAWSNDGALLYGGADRNLWLYNPLDSTFKKLADNLPDETEGLIMRPDGLLTGGVDGDASSTIFSYDVAKLRPVRTTRITSDYGHIQALAWLSSCGNPSTGGSANMISKVTIDKTQVCAGEPLTVTVDAHHPESPQGEVNVFVNNQVGNPQYLQFTGIPGPRIVHIMAVTPERFIDTKQKIIHVVACAPESEYPMVATWSNPYHENTVDFQVTNAAHFTSQNPTYIWAFGDGQTAQTTVPSITHDYSASLLRDQLLTSIQSSLTLRRNGQPDVTIQRVVSLWNMYAYNKQHGTIQPPTTSDIRLNLADNALVADFTITNLEDAPLQFTAQQITFQPCDPAQDPREQPWQNVQITIGGQQRATQHFSVPASTVASDICGLAVTLMGQSSQGLPAFAGVTFDVQHNPLMMHAEIDQRMVDLLNQVVAQGLVADPLRITDEDLYRLANEGKITWPLTSTTALPSTSQHSSSTTNTAAISSGSDIIGQPCSVLADKPQSQVGDPPPRIGVYCQPTNEWKDVPPRIANAYKGDIVITPGCGDIGQLLQQVQPPQIFDHSGIMVDNYYQLSNSTSAHDRYEDMHYIDKGFLTTQIRPDVLKYGWPGSINMSVKEAFNGIDLLDPEGQQYRLNPFSLEAERKEGCPAVRAQVIMPVPGSDPAVRERLHIAADNARKLADSHASHYRFFSYSDATIVNTPAGDDAGWAAGTFGSECSSFIWYVLKMAGITLEGNLEEQDARDGALLAGDDPALDGLYLYTATERLAAGEWLHAKTYNDVYNKTGWVKNPPTDAADNISNQVTNCFAVDACGTRNETPWRHAGEGRTVSPQDMLYWDAPATGGVYGWHMDAAFRQGEHIRMGRWAASPDVGTVKGVVRFQNQPLANVGVRITQTDRNQPPTPNWIEVVTASDGTFQDDLLPAGEYEIVASTTINGVPLEAQLPITIKAHEPTPVTLDLQMLPDNIRDVVIQGSMHIHDDDSGDPDCAWHDCDENGDFKFKVTTTLDPLYNQHADLIIEKDPEGHDLCVDDEVSVKIGIHLELGADNRSVIMTGTAYLYEGTSCNDDNVAQAPVNDSLSPGIPIHKPIHMDTGEGGYTDIDLQIVNVRHI